MVGVCLIFWGHCQFYCGLVFNLESYIPSCSGGPISLHHPFLRLPVRHLETPGGTPIWKGKECSSENLNSTPKGDNEDLLELHKTSQKIPLKTEWVRLLASAQESIPCVLVRLVYRVLSLKTEIKDVRAQKFPHTDFFKTLTACRKW